MQYPHCCFENGNKVLFLRLCNIWCHYNDRVITLRIIPELQGRYILELTRGDCLINLHKTGPGRPVMGCRKVLLFLGGGKDVFFDELPLVRYSKHLQVHVHVSNPTEGHWQLKEDGLMRNGS